MPAALRHHPGLGYWVPSDDPKGPPVLVGTFPAMVAAMTAPDGRLVNCLRTYLTEDGQKAPVPTVRKQMPAAIYGASNGAAICLYEPGKLLAACEGIETGLAVHLMTGFPVWVGFGTAGLASLVVPPTVEQVAIYADNDINGAGQDAARKLATRLYEQGIRARILVSPEPGTDWLDAYLMEKQR